MSSEGIALERYQVAVADWAAACGVPPPEVRIDEYEVDCATYDPVDMSIAMPAFFRDDNTVVTAVLMHEFAHYLDDPLTRIAEHGPSFLRHLCDLAELEYGDARLYPWHQEYDHILEWAIEHELVNTEEPPEE